MLENITRADFADLEPQALTLTIAGRQCHPHIDTLKEFTAHSERPHAPFTLILTAPHDWRYPQGIYELQHPTLGTLQLFMVPIGLCEQGMRFEIIFN